MCVCGCVSVCALATKGVQLPRSCRGLETPLADWFRASGYNELEGGGAETTTSDSTMNEVEAIMFAAVRLARGSSVIG